MGWVHPDISLEEMVKLTKGFVDILILASGYQSSGRIAHWDAQNIKKIFHWGLFFENVFSRLSGSDAYQDSVEELDAALSEMTSDASFPQGLAHLSSTTLAKARGYVLEHLIHTLPLRVAHLREFLTAVIEMELDELLETEHDCLNAYLKKLTLQNRSLISVPDEKDFLKDSVISSREMAPIKKNEKSIGDDLTKYALQEILKRKCAVSCISAVETGLDIILNTIRHNSESDNKLLNEQLKHEKAPTNVEPLLEFITWNHWKSRNLSYFLDKRTVRLVSGASLIFSAPKVQWIQVFQGLNVSAKSSDNGFSETIELLLLGCIASRWNCLIEHFMHVSYYSLAISEQYHELCSLVFGRSQSLNSTDEAMISKESSILEYLTGVLGGQLHQLWKLSPALAAAAIPSWSPFLRLYLSEIETQFKGKFSMTRCCNCSKDTEEHKDCELAERIWCLYIFHVLGPHLKHDASSA
ncbi:uncharacterized protein LOC115960658 isoform X1 [Quercus lobata]|uniref:Fanconi anemia group F protein n=1 Tax=Quercus lobata TaxID=97700 RepID=A0A7N2MKY6_QUELO|nr:uncharacterized protein LOC115960658 isoform X1 [Quercus lobata]XP_030935472.1 uncharacterized protein LOC115960658 isoform X1 [Quercus lobata]XP_030935473.1 uncharacterized protein LOC115960658 isoform X1 [Quercus lobata]XP_030935474.1 uncharacterized protein LOC115960658 isoform X1 [Quercus lobata]